MTREALADRVINYCDAIAAFSLVNAFAFLVTLAEPDIRCSIARISTAVILINLTLPIFITICLVGLRRFETSLRADGSGDVKEEKEEEEDERIDTFWRGVQAGRLVLVWTMALLVSAGVYAASQDAACRALVP